MSGSATVVQRNLSTSQEEELVDIQNGQAEEIRDIDIRENNKKRLRFRKMPWQELLGFLTLAALSLFSIYMRE